MTAKHFKKSDTLRFSSKLTSYFVALYFGISRKLENNLVKVFFALAAFFTNMLG